MNKLVNKLIRWMCAIIFIGAAIGGEIHSGVGFTKVEAIEAANRAAREAAKDKKTCWKPAKPESSKKDEDGYWVATAESANHPGSCGGYGWRKP